MRGAFGLLSAIFILLLLSSLVILTLTIQSNKVKKTSDNNMLMQAKLLAKSAEEFTVMAIGGFDRDTDNDNVDDRCLESLNINEKQFDINVTIHYLFANGQKPTDCNSSKELDIPQKQNGTVILDVVVASKTGVTSEPIRVHRRSVQLP